MNSEGVTLFVPVLLIMNMMVTRFFVETTQIKVSKGEVKGVNRAWASSWLILEFNQKGTNKMSNFFRINLEGGQLNQIFLVVVSKIFSLLPWKLGICFKRVGLPPNRSWNRQSIGFCLRKKKTRQDEAAVLAGLPTPPMRRNDGKRWETLVESVRISFCPKHGRISLCREVWAADIQCWCK